MSYGADDDVQAFWHMPKQNKQCIFWKRRMKEIVLEQENWIGKVWKQNRKYNSFDTALNDQMKLFNGFKWHELRSKQIFSIPILQLQTIPNFNAKLCHYYRMNARNDVNRNLVTIYLLINLFIIITNRYNHQNM